MELNNLWKEKTFTQFPNDKMGEIIKDKDLKIGIDIKIILFAGRNQLGFRNRKMTHHLMLSDFAKATRMSTSYICKRLKLLCENKKLYRGNRKGRVYKYSLHDVFSLKQEDSERSIEISTPETKISSQSIPISSEEISRGFKISCQKISEANFHDKKGEFLNLGKSVNKDLNKDKNKHSSFSSIKSQDKNLAPKCSLEKISDEILREGVNSFGNMEKLITYLQKHGYDEKEIKSRLQNL